MRRPFLYLLASMLAWCVIVLQEAHAMDVSQYIALSRQVALFRQMDVIANNVANANTAGFRSEAMMFQEFPVDAGRGNKVSFANDVATVSNLRQGEIEYTGRPLDAAIQGKGFFAIEAPQGVRYTRAGNFQIDAEGTLVNGQGFPVQGEGGPIAFTQGDSAVVIAEDGEISVTAANGNSEQRGKLGVFLFTNEQMLRKEGNTFFVANEVPVLGIAQEDYTIAQSMVERSNVNAIQQMTKMIKVSRSVGSTARFMEDAHDLQRRAISIISGQSR